MTNYDPILIITTINQKLVLFTQTFSPSAIEFCQRTGYATVKEQDAYIASPLLSLN